MMYQKNSSEFMKAFDAANDKLATAQEDIDALADKLQKKVKLLSESLSYATESINQLYIQSEEGSTTSKVVFADPNTEITAGYYDTFGVTVHPKIVRDSNVFNFKSGTNYIFKNNVVITIDGEEQTDMTYMLMHDGIEEKEYLLHEFDSENLVFTITTSKTGAASSMKFNVIELLPFLPGSFDIKQIDIYEIGDPSNPAHRFKDVNNAAAMRLILDEKVAMDHITFSIRLKRRGQNGKFLFGMKHLYLLNTDFDKNSYVYVKITKSAPITYIYDSIIAHTQFGDRMQTDVADIGAKFYLGFSGKTFDRELTVSTTLQPTYISANSNSVYMYVPIQTAFVAVTPDIRTDQ